MPLSHATGAGWSVAESVHSVELSATVVLPKLKCGRSKQAIIPNVSVIFSLAGEFVGCYNRRAHYFPYMFVDGRGLEARARAAHAGDTVALSLVLTSTKTVVSVVDKTRKHASKTVTGGAGLLGNVFEVDEQAVPNGHANPNGTGQVEGVPRFVHLTFSHLVLNGAPFGSAPPFQYWDWYRGGTLLIETTPISSNGESFTTIFKHS